MGWEESQDESLEKRLPERQREKPREAVPTGELVEGGKENAKFRGRARGPLQEAEKTEKAAGGEGFKHDR